MGCGTRVSAYYLTRTHKYAYCVHVASIDHRLLLKRMDDAGVTPKQLATATGKSLTYICDITAGRRTLKRNPLLRSEIAKALDCPRFWIEQERPDPEAAA